MQKTAEHEAAQDNNTTSRLFRAEAAAAADPDDHNNPVKTIKPPRSKEVGHAQTTDHEDERGLQSPDRAAAAVAGDHRDAREPRTYLSLPDGS